MDRGKAAQALGGAIRAARVASGKSQRDAAEEAGTSPSYLSQVEAGTYLPSLDRLLPICTAIALAPWEAIAALGGKGPSKAHVERFQAVGSIPLAQLLGDRQRELGRSLQGMALAAAAQGRHCGVGAFRSALDGSVAHPSVDRLLAFAAGLDLEDWEVLAAAGMPAPDAWPDEAIAPLAAGEGVRPLKVVGMAAAGEAFGAPPYPGDEVVWVPSSTQAAWALRVDGDSMCGARICHGDVVTVRPLDGVPKDGRVVVAEVLGALLVKRFRARPKPHLEEHFHGHEPRAVQAPEFRVLGEVVEAVHRVQ